MALVYHATWTKLVPRIHKQGLRTLQTSNWINGIGDRLGGGAIFAFESEWDAVRWAARMEWDHKRTHGSGKVSILAIDHAGPWDTDFNDTLTQASSEGRWLKTFQPIPAAAIVEIKPLTSAMIKALVSRQGCTFLAV